MQGLLHCSPAMGNLDASNSIAGLADVEALQATSVSASLGTAFTRQIDLKEFKIDTMCICAIFGDVIGCGNARFQSSLNDSNCTLLRIV